MQSVRLGAGALLPPLPNRRFMMRMDLVKTLETNESSLKVANR